MSGRAQTTKKRSGKGGNVGKKKARTGSAAGTGSGLADIARDQGGSSKDPKVSTDDPYGFVEQQVRIPGG